MSIAEKLTKVAENVPKVYEAGKKDEHDKFWDTYQENGTRTNYERAFEGRNFTFDNFYPKHDLFLEGMNSYLLYNWRTARTTFKSGSLKQRLEECGVKFNTSKATNLSWAFAYNCFTELPTIDLTGLAETPSSCFAYGYEYLKTIEKIIIAENTPLATNMFSGATGLKNLVIDGTIGKNNFNVSVCPLTHDSLMSIVNALKDYSKDTSGTVYTVTLGSSNIAKLTDSELLQITQKGWQYK